MSKQAERDEKADESSSSSAAFATAFSVGKSITESLSSNDQTRNTKSGASVSRDDELKAPTSKEKLSILKKERVNSRQSILKAQFDEENLKKTLHPKDKDYGYVKISEPPTPFIPPGTKPQGIEPGLDCDSLMKKLNMHEKAQKTDHADNAEDYVEKREHDKFVQKRMNHYENEFATAKRKSSVDSDVQETDQVKKNTEYNKNV